MNIITHQRLILQLTDQVSEWWSRLFVFWVLEPLQSRGTIVSSSVIEPNSEVWKLSRDKSCSEMRLETFRPLMIFFSRGRQQRLVLLRQDDKQTWTSCEWSVEIHHVPQIIQIQCLTLTCFEFDDFHLWLTFKDKWSSNSLHVFTSKT